LAKKLGWWESAVDFNEEPFYLGPYDAIATFGPPKSEAAPSFMLGSEFRSDLREDGRVKVVTVRHECEFVSSGGRPVFRRVDVHLVEDGVRLGIEMMGGHLLYSVGAGRSQKEWETPFDPEAVDNFPLLVLLNSAAFLSALPKSSELNRARALLGMIGSPLAVEGGERLPYASAPIRARPERTYDPVDDSPRPQGEHVPMVLARVHDGPEWDGIRRPLESFAKAAGLFDRLIIKRLGRNLGDPFQVLVRLGGARRNLIDVGYGVSQALPLIVELFRDRRKRTYLIQQPEVHLHPRAQAELGSLLATVACTQPKQLLVETHSDYLVDRVRMDVSDKRVPHDKVLILYFERTKQDVEIHPIEIDERGNLRQVPPGYRSFFLEEEERFLGF
jgi:hypothetical protein